LDGLDHEGDPSFLVYNYLKPYYPPGTKQSTYISLCYNIPDDDGGAGLARYEGDVGRAIAKLSGYVTIFIERFPVSLSFQLYPLPRLRHHALYP
jgi:hypothetical protein